MSKSALAASLRRTPLPLYLQAAALLRQRLEKGEWRVGERLPSIERLAAEIPMARLTIRQGMAVLEEEGLIRCRHGSGTYVARDISSQRRYRVATDWRSLLEEISEGTQKALSFANPPAFPDAVSEEGRLAKSYRCFKRLNMKDGLPYGFMTYHLASTVFDRAPTRFLSAPVLPTLARLGDVRIQAARQTMQIATADPEASSLLGIQLNAPVVLARRVVTDDAGVIIYLGHITYRGDYVRFEVDLKPRAFASRGKGNRNKRRI